MPLAKARQTKPRDLAGAIVERLEAEGIAEITEAPKTAGPGFINLKLKDEFLCKGIAPLLGDERLGVEPAAEPQHVVVDFSSPNLAKEMHVGHLRSTIIGDAVARLLEFEGHRVSRINHVGDFGSLGLLIQYVRETQPEVATAPEAFHISDLEEFYREAREKELNDPAFAEAARSAIVDLQRKEPTAVALWRAFRAESLRHCRQIYDRLGVRLETVGESDYLDELPGVVDEFRRQGLITEDKGARCIFLDGFKNREGGPLPMIVQKSDGGYLYATTDLAALRRRSQQMHADRIVYVTDLGQRQHLRMVFAAGRTAGFVGPNVRLDHVGFGVVQGADRTKFKTRAGGTVKLADLLDEAEERALNLIRERGQTYSTLAEGKRRGQTPEQQAAIARAVGLGAVKYADLSQDLTSDYIFSWDKMLSFDGNTAPYMMYAYARIRSVFDRANADPAAVASACPKVRITHPSERALMLKLLQFPDLMESITDTWRIHELPNYLFTLANVFMGLYQDKANWPILEAEPAVRDARLALCGVTANALKLGLGLLGIDVVEQM
jgi:arginyl-tRNA synthetase